MVISPSFSLILCLIDIHYDNLGLIISEGELLEETHNYAFGLLMPYRINTDELHLSGRHKYQSNEYIQELGLNWVDFHARQYDPQIGRFLGIDPLENAYGQQIFSTYAAMGNAPTHMIDPTGTNAQNMMLMPANASSDGNGWEGL